MGRTIRDGALAFAIDKITRAFALLGASGLTMQRREFLIGGAAAWLTVVVLLLIGVGGYALVRHIRVTQIELKREEDRRAEAEAKGKLEEAGQQRLAMEQERQARAAAAVEATRKSEEAEQQRIAALRAAAEEEERTRAETEARTRYAALVSQGNADSKAGNYDRAIADYNEAIRLDSKSTLAFIGRGDAYTNKGDHAIERSLIYNEAIRLDPNNALALSDRGIAYANKKQLREGPRRF